jgi:hypothetical protein
LVGAATAALGVFFGSLTFQGGLAKAVIKKRYKTQVLQNRDNTEKDASDAVALDQYGGRAGNESVDGWGWSARRLRAKQIQCAVDAKYLKP